MSKKTETIEVRVSPELKAELSSLCKDRGQAMSQTVRDLIQMELSNSHDQSTILGVNMHKKSTLSRARDIGIASVSVLSLAVVWTAFVPTVSIAQPGVRATFATMDLNEDGVITKREFREANALFYGELEMDEVGSDEDVPAACEKDFATMDQLYAQDDASGVDGEFHAFDENRDGELRFEEVKSRMDRELRAEFVAMDADKSGALTKDEFSDGRNGDGLAELMGVSAACAQALSLVDDEFKGIADAELRAEFAEYDANRNGQISLAEYLDQ